MTEIEGDLLMLIDSALGINDQLEHHADHVVYKGGMNQAEAFRAVVNRLHWKYRRLYDQEPEDD